MRDLLIPLAALVGSLLAGLVVYAASYSILSRVLPHTGAVLERSLLRNVRKPLRSILALSAVEIAAGVVTLPPDVGYGVSHGLGVLLIAALCWLVVKLTYVVEDVVLSRHQLGVSDNLRSRRVHTQIQIFRRISVVVVAVLGLAAVLMSFGRIRAIGAGLLASAGIVGIIAGLAARPVITNLLAGIQIAISQPIKIDDVVVVEGHWGRVEEISLTYVVVRIWDLRRLVLPIVYFIENPFENWTRQGSKILGFVHLQVDYSAPVEAIRQKFHEILLSSPRWDGDVWTLQVTAAGTETMELRALMSAKDSATSWDLCCEVREKLIAYLQEQMPSTLPKLRADIGFSREMGRPASPDETGHASLSTTDAAKTTLASLSDQPPTEGIPGWQVPPAGAMAQGAPVPQAVCGGQAAELSQNLNDAPTSEDASISGGTRSAPRPEDASTPEDTPSEHARRRSP